MSGVEGMLILLAVESVALGGALLVIGLLRGNLRLTKMDRVFISQRLASCKNVYDKLLSDNAVIIRALREKTAAHEQVARVDADTIRRLKEEVADLTDHAERITILERECTRINNEHATIVCTMVAERTKHQQELQNKETTIKQLVHERDEAKECAKMAVAQAAKACDERDEALGTLKTNHNNYGQMLRDRDQVIAEQDKLINRIHHIIAGTTGPLSRLCDELCSRDESFDDVDTVLSQERPIPEAPPSAADDFNKLYGWSSERDDPKKGADLGAVIDEVNTIQ